jgi:two-component system, NarL family, sensor kinase
MEAKEGIDITILIAIATIGVLFLVFFIILMVLVSQKRHLASKNQLIDLETKHQKRLLEASMEIAEFERQKIAANLHDDIGIIFTILKMNISRIKKNANNPKVMDGLVDESIISIDNSLKIVRGIYNDILPPTLKHAGVVKALHELSRELSAKSAVTIEFSAYTDTIPMDKAMELQLFRLVKEVLNNTIKHANPGFITIDISQSDTSVNIIILHNGMGITTEKIKELAKTSEGIGLKSILTRSELINGSIEFLAPSPGSSIVEIKMKLA